MTVVRYLIEIDTTTPDHQIRQLDERVAGELHSQFPLCVGSGHPQQRARLYRIDSSGEEHWGRGRITGETKYVEILYDPVHADHEAPPGYVSPHGIDGAVAERAPE